MTDISLKDAVGELRTQIAQAQADGKTGPIGFEILEAEVQIQGSFSRSVEGGGGGTVKFTVFGFGAEAGAEGKAGYGRETTQTVTLKLRVFDRDTDGSVDINTETSGQF